LSILSDSIEQFIKTLIMEYEGSVQIQRNELASYFKCAPSQINYVLATRFNLDKGYIIESKRGGGGFIKLIPIDADDNYLYHLVKVRISDNISEREAFAIVDGLLNLKKIVFKESAMMKAAVSTRALNIPTTVKDNVRANILKEMIMTIMK
jgi:transcriptional regulator of stress and heat shock response